MYKYTATNCEIDGGLFFDNISMDTRDWAIDYDTLIEIKPVFEYMQENYAEELEALRTGEVDYINLYYDV